MKKLHLDTAAALEGFAKRYDALGLTDKARAVRAMAKYPGKDLRDDPGAEIARLERDVAARESPRAPDGAGSSHFEVTWIDRGYEAKVKPDPRYPHGMTVDGTAGQLSCTVSVPYPAPRCGYYWLRCKICGTTLMATTTGRRDDPHTIKIPCKSLAKA